MPTVADFDKALHREMASFATIPAATIVAALPQDQARAPGGWQADWPTLTAPIETPGSAVQAMGQVAAGLEIDADALQANMRRSALAVGRRSDSTRKPARSAPRAWAS